jgi:capsular exopolysaccharide synthesis family protein
MIRSQLQRRAERELASDDFTGRLVTVLDPSGAASEDYRALRTSLMYALVDTPPKVIVVSSPGAAEGKSTTCANLGVVLAQADKSTLVVDCNLRKPVMHKIFGLKNLRGLVNILAGEYDLREASQELRGLKVITAGPPPPNSAELLSSGRFAEFLGQARREFDYVLVDVPPLDLVSDPTIAATQADGVLLVLDAQSTRKGAVRRAVRNLESVGAKVLGTVINNIEASERGFSR